MFIQSMFRGIHSIRETEEANYIKPILKIVKINYEWFGLVLFFKNRFDWIGLWICSLKIESTQISLYKNNFNAYISICFISLLVSCKLNYVTTKLSKKVS